GGWEVMIPPKESASLTLKVAGPIYYFCRFHPNMKGRLVVAP
ncbi:MAG: amicyanin, partial [Mesorhizobium sp.]